MEEIVRLPQDYFDQFIAHEAYFRKQYVNVYFSKPFIYEVDGRGLVIAGWGNPGWVSPVVFPYAHYISITDLNAETTVYELKDLLTFLIDKYLVTQYADEPIPYIKVDMPDFMTEEKKEQEFWEALAAVPKVQRQG